MSLADDSGEPQQPQTQHPETPSVEEQFGPAAPAAMPRRARPAGRFEQFTPRAQHVLALAETEARRLNHAEIQPEHLLLGILREGTGLAVAILQRAGLDLERLRADAEQRLGQGNGSPPDKLALSSACQHVLRLAVEESTRLHQSFIGTEHILIGLLREGGSLDPTLFTQFALDTMLRGIYVGTHTSGRRGTAMKGRGSTVGLVTTASGTPATGMSAAPRDNVLSIRVSDDDLAAVDAMVEIGIARSRSEAAAWLIGSGITANRPLFERAQNVISEVRRLREEAQQLAQEHAVGQESQNTSE
jgi:hypothetical protein